MRKLNYLLSCLCVCLALIICISTQTVKVSAKVEYRRIITEDTPFYSDANGVNLLFYLPYTYYVKVLAEDINFSHVECYGLGSSIAIDGYVPTSMLFNDDLAVINPYLDKQITTVSTTVLYSDKNMSIPLQYLFASRTLKYYGHITADDGSTLFYVGYNNKLGYVEESTVYPFEITLHPNELTFIEPELPPEEPTVEPTEEPSNDKNGVTTLRIIVVACLLLAGLVALFIALKNKPKKQLGSSYYDENEYE